MKNAIITFAFALITIAGLAKDKESVHVISTRMNVVYLKMEKELVGSTIEIANEAGEVIATAKVYDRKVLIDFDTVNTGLYTIKVKKNEVETVFDYQHTEDSMTDTQQTTRAIEIVQGI